MIKQDSFILIWLENVSISNIVNPDAFAVENINLRIDAGEYVCISGLHGTDKISFINTLSCLDKPKKGKYIYDYNDITTSEADKLGEIRSKIGFVFRNPNIVEQLSVYGNLHLPLSSKDGDFKKLIHEVASSIEIDGILNKQAQKLSDMDRHKIALARAFVVKPVLIIADEPAEGLKHEDEAKLLKILKEANLNGVTIVSFSERSSIINEATRHIQLENRQIKSDSTLMSFTTREGAV